MTITLKKNIMPAFPRDIKSSLEFMRKIGPEIIFMKRYAWNLDLGFEAIVRYQDMENLDTLAENLKACEGYPISLHAPLNMEDPKTVDLTTTAGFEIAERLIEFADRNGISLIVSHPNCLMDNKSYTNLNDTVGKENLENGYYSKLKLSQIVNRAQTLNKMSSNVKFSLENKPYPATDANNEGVMHSPVLGPLEHLLRLREEGIPITFDTAHYGISRSTINGILAGAEWNPEKGIPLYGRNALLLPNWDLVHQPTIRGAIASLDESILEIHLNDAAPYQGVDGLTTYWEALIPGKGSLVQNRDIIPFLKERKSDLSVVMEVMETDYENCPNTYGCFTNFLRDLNYD